MSINSIFLSGHAGLLQLGALCVERRSGTQTFAPTRFKLPLLQGAVPAKLRPQAAPTEGGAAASTLFSNALATLVMRSRLAAILSLVVLLGCVGEMRLPYQSAPVRYDNPVLLRIPNHELVWDGVVDVISDYFRIEREDPVRLLGNTLTEGRIDTFPKPSATLLEPWDHDSVDSYQRLESTLQSIRRYAVVKVIPAPTGGFWVDVAVYKELENIRQPEHTTGARPPPTTTCRPPATTPQSPVTSILISRPASIRMRFSHPVHRRRPACSRHAYSQTEAGFPRGATRSPSSGSSVRSSTASRPKELPSP